MASAFTFEPIVDNIAIGGQINLSLDKDGNPGIVFSDRNAGTLFVAHRPPSGQWSVDTVTESFISGAARPRLAFDSTGNPQVAYRNRADSALIHGVKRGGAWSLTPIPTKLTPTGTGAVGSVAFALHPGRLDPESRDVGFFVYVDLTTDGIGFAHTGSIGPTPVTVELDPNHDTTFASPSAVFDSSEGFFVAYTAALQNSISVKASLILDIEQGTFGAPSVIDQSLNVRSDTSIVRTTFGGCIAYYDMASRTVKANVISDGFSSIETVATGVTFNDAPSAAIQRGQFRVAYADSGGIMLASRSESGAWTSEVVEAVSGTSPSLAYDNAGTANISYVVGSKLRFARRTG
jgi:hypothetical protein